MRRHAGRQTGGWAFSFNLSRPHLANALAGRYALSEAKVEKLHAFLEQPPPVVQPRLL